MFARKKLPLWSIVIPCLLVAMLIWTPWASATIAVSSPLLTVHDQITGAGAAQASAQQNPPPAGQPYWPSYAYDRRNTGRSPYSGPESGQIAWTFAAEQGRVINQQQTVDADGTIYFGTWGSWVEGTAERGHGKLYALNPDGSLKWIYDPGPLEDYYLGTIETTATIGPDGTIYFGRGDGILRAVNPDGTEKWTFETIPNTVGRGQIFSSPAVAQDGTIYFGTGDYALLLGVGNNVFYALEDKGDHAEIKWTFPENAAEGGTLMNWIFCNPAIGDDGTVYFSSGRVLYAFSPDGQERWHYRARERMWNPTIGDDGTVYVQAFNYNGHGVVYALNPDGSLKWTYAIDEPVVSGVAIAADGTLYFGSDGGQDGDTRLGKLYALLDCGQDCVQEKWPQPVDFGLNLRMPTIGGDGTLYVALRGDLDATPPIPGQVLALRDIGTGVEVLWQVEANGEIWMGTPVIGPDNTLYFADAVCRETLTCDQDSEIPSVYAVKGGPTATTGTIAGTVRDTAGQPIDGVEVTLFGTALSATTDANGRYAIQGVPPAAPRYIVTASKTGYRDAQAGNIDVAAGATTTVDLVMAPGEGPAETLHAMVVYLVRRDPGSPMLTPPPDAVLDAGLYPAEVLPYLESGQYIEADDPAIVAVAQSILNSLSPEQQTQQTVVAHAVYVWMVQNIEYDLMRNYPDDVTSGNWQTTYGAWGHSFAEWLYTAREVLEEGRGICIEHARLATALLRAVGIPARPAPLMAHPVTQWWVQLPDGSGFWANMDTSKGRSAFVRSGDLWANFPSVAEHELGFWATDADAPIHEDWWTDNPTLWREDYGHRIHFPATPQGLAQAQAALAHFAETGELPPPQPGPPLRDDLPYFELGTRGFVIDLTNAAGQTHFDISFTLAAESDTVQRIDQVHWTNHPEWVTGARLEAETDPVTGETLTSYRLTLDRGV